jgi:2-phospho-L-lactate transferase/gluconeogenesis factor (CofD/UPF0052 family)/molybdopterin-guanine dinucleotide biosynthesis protein A
MKPLANLSLPARPDLTPIRDLVAPTSHQKTNPLLWTLLVPVAGRGSRLLFDGPKCLFPIAGRPMLCSVLEPIEALFSQLVLVVAPRDRRRIEKVLHGYPYFHKIRFATQTEPRGMADAIYTGLESVATENVATLWGDQVLIRPTTVAACLFAHESRPGSCFTLPTIHVEKPYTSIERNEAGQITAVHQAREGQIPSNKKTGESDIGFFAFTSDALRRVLAESRASDSSIGAKTKEWNLLPLFPRFETHAGSVLTLRMKDVNEGAGVNTRSDARKVEKLLVARIHARSNEHRISIALFSGGRGCTTIIENMVRQPQVKLQVLVNTYDDGLSTGRLRKFIPGMLGPSDIRKTYTTILGAAHPQLSALRYLLEYRLPQNFTSEQALDLLAQLINLDDKPSASSFAFVRDALTLDHARIVSKSLRAFLDYYQEQVKQGGSFSFADCSLGNLVFGGIYLQVGRNFNEAVRQFTNIVPISAKVLNVTQGEGYCLSAIKQDGSILFDEASIVSEQSPAPITELFLFEAPLSESVRREVMALPASERTALLKKRSLTPLPNPDATKALESADAIVYGPGTQHSSLLPSYLTKGIGEVIANSRAEKIFVCNIQEDNETVGESAGSIYQKVIRYLSKTAANGVQASSLVTRCFLQSTELERAKKTGDQRYIPVRDRDLLPPGAAVFENWEGENGKHLGGRILDAIVRILGEKRSDLVGSRPHMVSILVPALNEAAAIDSVLQDLGKLDFGYEGLTKEILVLDGGSTDGTYEIAASHPAVSVYKVPDCKGRGEAIRHGIAKARGSIVVTFPCDGEYDAEDLYKVIAPITKGEAAAVFGSRAIKCVNVGSRILEIYGGKKIPYLISRYGGLLLSLSGLVLYNRFVTDPLTGIKAFSSQCLQNLKLSARGIDLETEFVAQLSRNSTFILELPVSYVPRRKKDGKKTTILGGIGALWILFRLKLANTRA